MQSKPSTVKEYLASLDPERRRALEAIRKVIKANLDPKIKEAMSYGMPGYVIPHSVYPDGYHCDPKLPLPYASVASQKNHIGLYLFCLYCSDEHSNRFQEEWKATGKKLDMGKSCIRVKKLEDIPLEVVGAAIKRLTAAKFIAEYEASRSGSKPSKKPAPKKKAAAKKVAAKKPAARKKAAKKATAKKKSTKKAASRRS